MRRLFLGLFAAFLIILQSTPGTAASAAGCRFVLGFQTLHDLAPADIGSCVDGQAYAENGDAQQHTTKGLMVWRKADNWTAFTNGATTWINGPDGLAKRPNSQRFPWEHDGGAPASGIGPLTIAGQAFTSRGRTVFLRGININNGSALYIADGSDAAAMDHAAWAIPDRITVSESDYASLQRWGANMVRFGLDWHWFQGQTKAAAYRMMDQQVTWAREHNIWLIPVMYVPQGGAQGYGPGMDFWGGLTSFDRDNMSPDMASLRDFWVEFAGHYASEPAIAGYDLLNEPSTSAVSDLWLPYASYLHDQIKAVDPNHFVVVESGADATFPDTLPLDNATKYTDVVYSVHDYLPASVTESSSGNYTYPGTAPDYDGTVRAWNKQTLADQMQAQGRLPIAFGATHNVPIFVGEFGAKKSTNGYVRYIADTMSLFNSWGVSWAFFDYRDADAGQWGLYSGGNWLATQGLTPDTTLITAVKSGLSG